MVLLLNETIHLLLFGTTGRPWHPQLFANASKKCSNVLPTFSARGSHAKRLKMHFVARGPIPRVRITRLEKVLTSETPCGSRSVFVGQTSLCAEANSLSDTQPRSFFRRSGGARSLGLPDRDDSSRAIQSEISSEVDLALGVAVVGSPLPEEVPLLACCYAQSAKGWLAACPCRVVPIRSKVAWECWWRPLVLLFGSEWLRDVGTFLQLSEIVPWPLSNLCAFWFWNLLKFERLGAAVEQSLARGCLWSGLKRAWLADHSCLCTWSTRDKPPWLLTALGGAQKGEGFSTRHEGMCELREHAAPMLRLTVTHGCRCNMATKLKCTTTEEQGAERCVQRRQNTWDCEEYMLCGMRCATVQCVKNLGTAPEARQRRTTRRTWAGVYARKTLDVGRACTAWWKSGCGRVGIAVPESSGVWRWCHVLGNSCCRSSLDIGLSILWRATTSTMPLSPLFFGYRSGSSGRCCHCPIDQRILHFCRFSARLRWLLASPCSLDSAE